MSVQDRLKAAIKANNLAEAKALIEHEQADPNSIKITESDDDDCQQQSSTADAQHFMYPLLYLATRDAETTATITGVVLEGSIPVSPLLAYLLLKHPSMQDLPDPDGATLLLYACCAGSPSLVRKLLYAFCVGADDDVVNGVSRDVVAKPTLYRDNGLDDNLSDKTPLAATVERGDADALEIAKLLLRAGAERSPPAPHVLSALHLAVESDAKFRGSSSSAFPFLALLLDNGYDVNLAGRTVWAPAGESDFDKSLLAQACFVDQYSDLGRAQAMIRFLLSRGARWNAELDTKGFIAYRKRNSSRDGAARPFAMPINFAKNDAKLRQQLIDAGCPDFAQLPTAADDSDSDDCDGGEAGGDLDEGAEFDEEDDGEDDDTEAPTPAGKPQGGGESSAPPASAAGGAKISAVAAKKAGAPSNRTTTTITNIERKGSAKKSG